MNEPDQFVPTQAALGAAWRDFRGLHYLRHNARRQEHLASLGLNLQDRSVLELGAGIGDHTTYFLDRGCTVTSVEPRPENCQLFGMLMQERAETGYAAAVRSRILRADAISFEAMVPETFEVVYCYGLLYHVDDPAAVLAAAARKCRDLLLLETWVSFGNHEAINPVPEDAAMASQAISAMGCRPTRPWIFNRLKAAFAHVYMPRTQPAHEEFPLDWTARTPSPWPTRAIFIASRRPLDNPLLLDHVPDRQST